MPKTPHPLLYPSSLNLRAHGKRSGCPTSRFRLPPSRHTPWHSPTTPLSFRAHVNSPPPCLTCLQLVETQTYQDICTKHFDASSCINNPAANKTLFFDYKMNERTDAYACADGYCTCSASTASA